MQKAELSFYAEVRAKISRYLSETIKRLRKKYQQWKLSRSARNNPSWVPENVRLNRLIATKGLLRLYQDGDSSRSIWPVNRDFFPFRIYFFMSRDYHYADILIRLYVTSFHALACPRINIINSTFVPFKHEKLNKQTDMCMQITLIDFNGYFNV